MAFLRMILERKQTLCTLWHKLRGPFTFFSWWHRREKIRKVVIGSAVDAGPSSEYDIESVSHTVWCIRIYVEQDQGTKSLMTCSEHYLQACRDLVLTKGLCAGTGTVSMSDLYSRYLQWLELAFLCRVLIPRLCLTILCSLLCSWSCLFCEKRSTLGEYPILGTVYTQYSFRDMQLRQHDSGWKNSAVLTSCGPHKWPLFDLNVFSLVEKPFFLRQGSYNLSHLSFSLFSPQDYR